MASVKSLFRIPTLRNEPVDVAGQLCRADADGYITTDDGGGFTLAACAVLEQVAIVERIQGATFLPPVNPEQQESVAARPEPKAKPAKKHATKGGRK